MHPRAAAAPHVKTTTARHHTPRQHPYPSPARAGAVRRLGKGGCPSPNPIPQRPNFLGDSPSSLAKLFPPPSVGCRPPRSPNFTRRSSCFCGPAPTLCCRPPRPPSLRRRLRQRNRGYTHAPHPCRVFAHCAGAARCASPQVSARMVVLQSLRASRLPPVRRAYRDVRRDRKAQPAARSQPRPTLHTPVLSWSDRQIGNLSTAPDKEPL